MLFSEPIQISPKATAKMKGKLLTIVAVAVVAANCLFNICSALNGAKEAGRVVLKNSERVVYPTTEFPYTAMVEHKRKFRCGAVIITLRAVLTAAHCVKGIPGKQFVVRAGTFTKLDQKGSYFQAIKSQQKFVYPQYNKKSYDSDIAVLKLVASWIFNDFVKPAQLPQYTPGEPYKNREFVALGHGIDEYAQESKTLKKAIFKVLPRNQCLALQSDVPNGVLCVVGQDGRRGANYGDSGSPLIANHNPAKPQNDVVIGITAYIWDPKEQKGYSAYTNVALFLDWIKSNL